MGYEDLKRKCNRCRLCDTVTNQCVPKGTDSPYMYLVGEAPGSDEDIAGIPFVGRAGKFLHEMISPLGINENNCRFFNVCRCIPRSFDSDGNPNGFRAPNQDEIDACIGFLDHDIRSTNPKVIVALGSTAMRALLPSIEGTITRVRGTVCSYKNYTVIPTYHPSYMMRNPNNDKIRKEFMDDINKAMSIASGQTVVKKDNDSSTIMCKTFVEFNDFCKKYIDGIDKVAYDVETNAKEVHSEDHRVVGFSLASSKDHGCYAPLQSIDFTMQDSDKRMIEKRLTKILMSKNVTVYNCQHEWPVTLNWLNIEIPDVDDVFVMVKLMMGNADKYQGNGGLKVQCEENLNYKDWSEDIDKYFEYLWKYEENKDNMRRLLLKYYPSDSDIFDKVENIALNVIPNIVWDKDHPISYEYIPHLLVGRYGSIDSSVLFELRDFYEDKMRVESDRLGVDLFKGYEYWMDHHYAGYTLELNGAYWNDEKAQAVEDWCSNGMVESLKNLLKSPLSESFMKESLQDDFMYYLKDKYMDYVFDGSYIPIKTTKKTVSVTCITEEAENRLKTMSLSPKISKKGINTGVYSLQLGNFWTLCQDKIGKSRLDIIFDKFYREYMDDFMGKDQTIDSMKSLLNPTSTSKAWKDFMTSILIYDDIRTAKKYFGFVTILEDPAFDMDYYRTFKDYDTDEYVDSDKYTRDFNFKEYKASHRNIQYLDNNDTDLLKFVQKLRLSDINKHDRFEMFKKFINVRMAGKRYSQRKIKKVFREADDYKLETLEKSVMIDLFNYYELVGIDIEDRSTWSDRFDWLYNYQAYKKYAKMISTYISGKVGRKSVYYVNRESYSNGDKLSRRHRPYFETEKPDPNDCCVLQTDFKVNMADSGRWKATMHTMPSTETGGNIKGIITSRFKGGVIAMPDCSQAEVRVLAAQSGDENLIRAFQDEGMDIHKFVACFTGDTQIKLLNGEVKTFEELYNEKYDRFYVYSLNDNDELVPGVAHDVRISGYVNKLVEIELDSGDIFRCTPEHLWRTRNGYVKAEDLSIGTSITPLYLKYDRGYEMYYDLSKDKFEYTHRRVCDIKYPGVSFNGMVRHHMDINKRNNCPDNLVLMTWEEHVKWHSDPDNNPLLRYVKSEENRERMRKAMKDLNNDPEFAKARNERYAELGRNFLSSDGAFRNDPKYEEARRKSIDAFLEGNRNRTHESRVESAKKMLETRSSNAEWRKNVGIHLAEGNRNPSDRRKCRNVLSKNKGFLDRAKDSGYIRDTRRGWSGILNTIRKRVKELAEIDKVPESVIINEFFYDHLDFLRNNGIDTVVNHKVKSVRFIDIEEYIPVYDLTVDEYSNFCLNCSDNSGVFVHNSLIWHHGDISKVTKLERKIAKSSVFGILYGKSLKSFAEENFHGELDEAEKVYDYFYTSFPKIKDYVDGSHAMYDRWKKVVLSITGRFIDYSRMAEENGSDVDRVYRQCQNGIIQGETCLVYDTEIKMLDGTYKKIGELADSGIEEFYVYSYDESRDKIVPSKAIMARETKRVNRIARVTLDNGEIIECTLDHRFLMRNRSYVEAQYLNPGDSLMPMYIRYSDKSKGDYAQGYEMIIQNNGESEYTHRLTCEEFGIEVPKGHVRHHIDYNKYNNCPENIDVSMTFLEHAEFHRKIFTEFLIYKYANDTVFKSKILAALDRGRKTQIANPSEKQLENRENWKTLLVGWGDDPEKYERWYSAMKDKLFDNDEAYDEWRSKISESIRCNEDLISFLSVSMSEKNKNRKELYPDWYNNQRKAVSENPNAIFRTATHEMRQEWSRKYYENETEEQAERRREYLRKGHSTEEAKKNHKNASIERESNQIYNFNRIKKQLGLMYQLGLDWKSLDVWDNKDNRDLLVSNGLCKGAYRTSSVISKIGYDLFISMGEEFVSTYNHKVVSVEIVDLENDIPVYDITVPRYGNFALKSGIFVHNCDLAGMILYNICKFVKDNNLKSKPFCFIHDSIELDLHPDETFMMLDKLSPLFNEYPWEKFGVPMASDIVFSSNMGSEIECIELLHDNEYNDVTITMKGFKNDIDEVINGWRSVYDLVEKDESFESPDPVEVKVPMRCMFQEKVEITPKMGTSIYVVSERYHVIRRRT